MAPISVCSCLKVGAKQSPAFRFVIVVRNCHEFLCYFNIFIVQISIMFFISATWLYQNIGCSRDAANLFCYDSWTL